MELQIRGTVRRSGYFPGVSTGGFAVFLPSRSFHQSAMAGMGRNLPLPLMTLCHFCTELTLRSSGRDRLPPKDTQKGRKVRRRAGVVQDSSGEVWARITS